MTRRRAELDGVSDRVQAICGDLATIEPQPVDIALAFAVLHHLPDEIVPMMATIRRWLKPGGVFICVEPICYLPWIERLRQRLGVPLDSLDPGERKLNMADIRRITSGFSSSRGVHFRLFAKFGRWWPGADRLFRRVDALLRPLPGARAFASIVIEICRLGE